MTMPPADALNGNRFAKKNVDSGLTTKAATAGDSDCVKIEVRLPSSRPISSLADSRQAEVDIEAKCCFE